MFDHVAIAVSDRAASERFYRTVLASLGAEPGYAGEDYV
jgi:catechol 2,3-dioxygenase-like lactoylglutathione lyase family enzyme